jgi:hypothetical protein
MQIDPTQVEDSKYGCHILSKKERDMILTCSRDYLYSLYNRNPYFVTCAYYELLNLGREDLLEKIFRGNIGSYMQFKVDRGPLTLLGVELVREKGVSFVSVNQFIEEVYTVYHTSQSGESIYSDIFSQATAIVDSNEAIQGLYRFLNV